MLGDEIDEEHHVSRYCSPLLVVNGLPAAEAFFLKRGEKCLSVNWLEYFNTQDLAQAIDRVRQVFIDKGYRIKVKGRFASFQVRMVIEIISSHSRMSAKIIHKPEELDPSHCGVIGYTGHSTTDKLIALKIAKLARAGDMYPGKIS
ncbi:MAG: hypothetical protein F4246_08985 [Rhodothermaceae bacterium]|nr:hypothetical protein [Rhodothermaceae bacterium]MXX58890.1 hypothetical protein [Rhodothermaceae bacterium]MYD19469.1 hypothetical protein [Rhodothermaceae bacterium]MYD57136.1 hypothetical protein [Rhodothermaceae bacterium]MYI44270.1 hypothetical protein [Rhodothermaceae bacterium]